MRNRTAQNRYAKLLRLYPTTYRKQFEEPMLQTFGDMYTEHLQQHGNTFQFIAKTYLDTGLEIIKEHYKEVGMSTKKSTKIFITAGALSVLIIIGAVVVFMNNREASVISPLSSLKDARALSEGKKNACLADTQKAAAAVKEDDTFLDKEQQWSRFELIASEGIKDIPAGTNYEITINNYDGKTAKGAVEYDGEYGAYNYIIAKGEDKGSWKFESMTACQKS